MKKLFYAVVALSVILAWMAKPLSAQSTQPEGTRIVITKQTPQADGSILTETIVKEGAAAENFDLDDYLEDSGEEGVSLNIDINSNKDVRISRKTSTCTTKTKCQTKCKAKSNYKTDCTSRKSCSNKGFLGVTQMSDQSDRAGVVVGIIDNSAADLAGLERGDRILSLNDTETNSFGDISAFMRQTKAGDLVDLTYERDGLVRTISVEIGNQNPNNSNSRNIFRFDEDMDFDIDLDMDIDIDLDDAIEWLGRMPKNSRHRNNQKEACLGVFSSRSIEDGTRGSRINAFTDESAARTAGLQNGDLITAVDDEIVDGHNQLWNVLSNYSADDVVQISFMRDGEAKRLSVKLNACEAPRANIFENAAPRRERRQTTTETIVIKKAPKTATSERSEVVPAAIETNRSLELRAYRAFPNPTDALINVEFEAPKVPIKVALLDMAGQQLFGEEVNSFDGFYSRQFDLSAYTGTVIFSVTQGDKVFTERLIVNR